MNKKYKTTFRKEKVSNQEFWLSVLKRYSTARMLRKLRDNFDLKTLSEMTGYKRQYVYGAQEMTIKPSQDFINKLKDIENEI